MILHFILNAKNDIKIGVAIAENVDFTVPMYPELTLQALRILVRAFYSSAFLEFPFSVLTKG